MVLLSYELGTAGLVYENKIHDDDWQHGSVSESK